MTNRIGQQLGNYRLIQLLGQGSFADVYLGEHHYLVTQVAIKVLHMPLTTDEVEHFRAEARTIVGLKHPHIVRVFDFGVEEDVPYFVMNYVPNGSLRQRHSRGTRLPLEMIVGYVKQITDALQYAHQRTLIHGDVRPENMLLGTNNEILLSDFGAATLVQRSRDQDRELAVSTVSYMAPEQIQGKPQLASDQYALGVVVYEWLSGECPFSGSFTEVATQHLLTAPPPLREKVPTLPSTVEETVMTALAKDPQQRFESVAAFANMLGTVATPEQSGLPAALSLSPLPIAEPPSTSLTPLRKEEEKTTLAYQGNTSAQNVSSFHVSAEKSTPLRVNLLTKRKVMLAAFVLVLLAGSVGLLTYHAYQTATKAAQATATALANINNTATSRRDATATAQIAATATAQIAVTATALATAIAAEVNAYNEYVAAHGIMFGFDTAHTGNNPFEKVLDPSNINLLTLAWSSAIGAVTSEPAVVEGVVYVGAGDGSLYALDTRTGTKLWSYATGMAINYSSPAVVNGVVYVASFDNSLYALDARTGTKLWSYATGGVIESSPTVMNGVVYVGSWDGKVYALDARTGYLLWSHATTGNIVTSPAVVNGVVYVGTGDKSLYALDAGTGNELWSYATGSPIVSSAAVANGVVYVGSRDGSQYALDAGTGTKLWSYATGNAIGTSPVVANSIVYVGSDDHSLYALNAKTGNMLWSYATGDVVRSDPAVVNGVVYFGSLDGKVYAFRLP